MIVVDVDNCISHDEHRIGLILPEHPDPIERFHHYHMASIADRPANLEILIGQEAIALTAMPEMYSRIRIHWLKRHAPQVVGAVFRPNDNHEGSVALKRKMARALVEHGVEVTAAFDDRADVVEMYRDEFGWSAFQLAAHNTPYPHCAH
jgi:hypothetical protein